MTRHRARAMDYADARLLSAITAGAAALLHDLGGWSASGAFAGVLLLLALIEAWSGSRDPR